MSNKTLIARHGRLLCVAVCIAIEVILFAIATGLDFYLRSAANVN